MSLLGGGTGMVGDIWSTGAFSFESPLKDLLDAGDYTFEQLLAEDELLQELRGVHPQLIQFFSTPQAVTKLVEYVILPHHELNTTTHSEQKATTEPNGDHQKEQNIHEPPRDPGEWLRHHKDEENKAGKSKTPEKDPEMRHIRFPYMACEIICCEIQPIIDVLVDGVVPMDDDTRTSSSDAVTNVDEQPDENGGPSEGRQSTRILDLLFSLLYTTEPGQMDDYRAGYFDKILTVLFRRRPDDLAKYINDGGGKGAETLMKAMFNHLYSHSIMQVAQRLLLPKRPSPPRPTAEEEEGGAEIVSEEQDPAQDIENIVECDWSTSSLALEMLLDSLIDPKVPASEEITEKELEERRLDLSLNSSEVLITIIQNSMLSSETMLSLTSPDTIQRLVVAATKVRCAEGEKEFFSPHESLLTSAMNVLESLILQLGGYGAVGTMFLLPEEENQQNEDADGEILEKKQLIADLSSMIDHLPQLLDALAKLLRHPSTKEWTSPMQFSKAVPQPLLGSSRLRIVRVLESLVLLGDPEVDSKLVRSSCLEICLDLFWEFQWCSMLHQSVANLLVHVFEGQNARIEMQEYLLIRCGLLGRLMDSFTEVQENARIADVVMNLKDMNLNTTRASSVESEKGSTSDPLPVSEDDVEAALEKQEAEMTTEPSSENAEALKDLDVGLSEQISTEAVRFDSRDASTIGAAALAQAFRFGYMGHVIIICQALVHACSNEAEQDEQQMQLENGEPANAVMTGDGEMNSEPLLLAELVADHPLAKRWNEFVSTTLASETAVQSSPLGGYSGSGHDPLHSHRPGLADDGDIMGDDGMGPPAPPRGMLGGGDVIDMDDNDLDIAATMMANLSLTRPTAEGDEDSTSGSGSLESGDSERSYNSGETASERAGYAFDDPLGKAGALGIELGKLTQYKSEDNEVPRAGANTGDDDDDGNSSSDEEPDSPPDSGDVPVMDLFAGNFDYNDDTKTPDSVPKEEWSDFANFDQAEDEFGDFTSATTDSATLQQDESDSSAKSTEIEEIFGKGDHASLLDEEENPALEKDRPETEMEPLSAEQVEEKPEKEMEPLSGQVEEKPETGSDVKSGTEPFSEHFEELPETGSDVTAETKTLSGQVEEMPELGTKAELSVLEPATEPSNQDDKGDATESNAQDDDKGDAAGLQPSSEEREGVEVPSGSSNS